MVAVVVLLQLRRNTELLDLVSKKRKEKEKNIYIYIFFYKAPRQICNSMKCKGKKTQIPF